MPLKIDHIDEVITSIKGEHERTKGWLGFNMANWVEAVGNWIGLKDRSKKDCGTVACIAGHAFFLAKKKRTKYDLEATWGGDIKVEALRYLGLTAAQGELLFHGRKPDGRELELKNVPLTRAIKVLEHLKATGEVDWSIR